MNKVATQQARATFQAGTLLWASALIWLLGALASVTAAAEALPVSLEQVIDHAHRASRLAQLADVQRSLGQAEGDQVAAVLKPSLTVGGNAAKLEQSTHVPSNCFVVTVPEELDLGPEEEWEICLPPDELNLETEGWTTEASLSLRWVLFQSPTVRATRTLAELQRESALVQHEEAMEGLTLQVIELYYGVLQAEAAVHLLELAMEEAALEQEELDWQVAAAAASQAEYLQAVARRLELEGQLIQAQGALERARIALNHVAGYPLDTMLELQRPGQTIISVPTLWEALKAAENRPDIRKARIQLEQAEANRSLVRAQTGPSVQLFGQIQSGDFQYTLGIDRHGFGQVSVTHTDTELKSAQQDEDDWEDAISDLKSPTTDSWAVGVRASWELLDGGASKSQIEKADAQAELARLNLELLLTTVESELRQAEASVKGARGAWDAAHKLVEAMAEAEANMEEMYRRGAASERNLLQVRLARAQAEQGLLQAEYEYMKALVQYRQAAGLL